MTACLRQADLPAVADVEGVLLEDSAEPWWLCDERGCLRGGSGDRTAVDALVVESGIEPSVDLTDFLAVGSAESTQVFTACRTETGYKPAEIAEERSRATLPSRPQQFEVSMAWAECARANGVTPVTDPSGESLLVVDVLPVATLPVDITEEAIRVLLDACPAFDTAGHQAYEAAFEAMLAGGDEWEEFVEVFDPLVGFAAPGWDGQPVADGLVRDQALDAHLEELLLIVDSERRAYAGY
jgi:hypothetical protein